MVSYDERVNRRSLVEEYRATLNDGHPLPRTSSGSLSKSDHDLSHSETLLPQTEKVDTLSPIRSAPDLRDRSTVEPPDKGSTTSNRGSIRESIDEVTSEQGLTDSNLSGIISSGDSECNYGSSTNFEFIILKRKKLTPVDSRLVSTCKCGLVFDWYNRKHHCRACGDVYCHECTSNRMKIPKILVCYINTEGWWSPGEICRVCKVCSVKVTKYGSVRSEIEKLYRESLSLSEINFSILTKDTDKKQTIGIIPKEGISTWSPGALSYYLSEMRLIQYLFPGDKLTSEQIIFLKTNRTSFFDHSYWLMQLLKVDVYDGIYEQRNLRGSDSIQTLCTKGCKPSLKLSDAVAMIHFFKIYEQSQELAWSIINKYGYDEIEPYLPIILTSVTTSSTGRGKESKDLEDAITSKITSGPPQFQCSIYWQLNSIDSPLADISKHRFLQNIEEGILNFRYILNVLDTLLKGKLVASDLNWHRPSLTHVIEKYKICDPFNPVYQIRSIENIWMGGSSSKPIFIEYINDSSSTPHKMLYKREDVRKDVCIVRLVNVLAKILELDPLNTEEAKTSVGNFYNVLPLSSKSGIIEIVKECSTLSKIYQEGSISNYLQKHNPTQIVKKIQDVYRNSLAFWTIVTYILGIGDRHFDNIMITTSGKLFHIDFDFIFGKDSKVYAPKIRLNSYMIEGLGGEEKYGEFKEQCRTMFMTIRQNIDTVYVMLLNLVVAIPSLGITESYIKEHLIKSFFIGELDTAIKDRLEFIIDECKNSLVGGINDYIHTAATTNLFSYLSL